MRLSYALKLRVSQTLGGKIETYEIIYSPEIFLFLFSLLSSMLLRNRESTSAPVEIHMIQYQPILISN